MLAPTLAAIQAVDSSFLRFATHARTHPQVPAVQVEATVTTYGELLDQVEQCAAALSAHGCVAGSPVAVVLPNSLDFVVATLAIFAIGGILVPLSPKFKEDELRHCIVTSKPKAVFHPVALETLIAPLCGPEVLRAHSATELLGRGRFTASQDIDLAAPALYMFSSGSTGKSKRVTRTQRNLLAEYDALVATANVNVNDCILCTVPLYHAHGFCNTLLAALLTGARLILPSGEFNARTTMNLLVENGVTIYPAVPFMFKMLCDTRFSTPPDLSSLRLAFSAGAPLPVAVAERFAQLYDKTVGQLYGSTETGAISLNVHQQADKPSSVGRPLHGYEVQIREEDGDGRMLDAGAPGEIWIRTPAMTRQYDGLPEMTQQYFAGDFFFAGDTGYLDADGYLYVTGRKKLLINVAGYKVDPLEVEEVLARHPQVSEAVVIGVEHPGYGEKVKAVVIPRNGVEACDEREILEFAAAHLADYKVPKLIEFRDELPRSPLGKILRKYL